MTMMLVERSLVIAGVVGMLALASDSPASLEGEAGSEQSEAPCCFSNPAYAGTCIVQPAEDETCGSILAYLNNAMAQGKSYCGGTKIRGGWAQVACE